jgi:deferrochelatase/peroxidase EfeB
MSGEQRGAVELGDVQGIVHYAHNQLTDACYFLLRIAEPEAARAWLRSAPVTSAAATSPLPRTALQIAFTAPGLRALGVPESVVSQFSPEFVSGIAGDENRSRRLGDTGADAPRNWAWGTNGREPHVLAALFADAGTLDVFAGTVQTDEWSRAFDPIACLDTSNLGGFEQFGFTDGISQPDIDWPQERKLSGDKPRYGNTVALGEFLLGYRNEYDCYTERPLVSSGGVNDLLAPAEDDPSKRDVGRNGTYLVLRDLRQDVRAFWSFAKSEELASALVGRRTNGDPLVPLAATPIEGIGTTPQALSQNNFTYADDPDGTRCPFGAHIRRANPRNADFPEPPSGSIDTVVEMLGLRQAAFHDDLTSSVRFHRVLRRGREYGPRLTPSDAQTPAPENDPPRGLRFLCLNANITRQFEFLQNAWIASDSFNGLIGEADPLLGNRESGPGGRATNAFVLNRVRAARRRITGLPRFVTVTGGAYFFLPGLRTLRYFVQAGVEGVQ